jgi:hypothetical protein
MAAEVVGAVPWSPVQGGTCLGLVALATDRWLVPGGPGSALLWIGLAGCASAAAFVLDEAAAAAVDAAPRTRRWRTVRRLGVGLLPLLAWLAGAAVAAGGTPLSWRALAVTGTGLVAVTVAAAAALRRLGHETPGELVAAAVGVAVLLGMLFAVPKVGPVLEGHDASSRSTVWWILLGAVAAGVTAWGAADPWSGRRRGR